MKIRDIIVEEAGHAPDPKKLSSDQVDAIKGAKSVPDLSMNKSDGSAYMQYRHGIALACAGAGDIEDEKMDPDGAFSGDPLFSSFTNEEDEMIDRAAAMVGAGKVNRLSSNDSTEMDDVHKHSAVPHNSGRHTTAKKKK